MVCGNFKIKTNVTSIGRYTDLVDVVQFTQETPTVVDNESHLQEVLKITREARTIMDELMLIGADEALSRLREFENA